MLENFKERLLRKTSVKSCFWLSLCFSILVFGCLFTVIKKSYDFSVNKMFIEIRLSKGHVKVVKICMLKFNVSILKKLKKMFFWYIQSIYIKDLPLPLLWENAFFHVWTLQAALISYILEALSYTFGLANRYKTNKTVII